VEGSGNTKRFVCGYHRWTYDLDGSLASAPLMDEVPGFKRDGCRLPELPLEEWQGFVFATLHPDPQPLAPQLEQLEALIKPSGLGEFVEGGVLDFDSPWNWKVMVENFMESYHHQGPHAKTLQPTNPAKGTHAMDMDGAFVALENPGETPFWVLQVFPTMLFALTRGDVPFATWYEMQIDRQDHFDLRIHLLLSPAHAAVPEIVDGVSQALTEIHLEDIPMCEGIQRGIQSRLWQPGPLAVHERCLQQFHRYLAERLATA
jgi:phenylpropionate dioxygenase-like ring-hydroxylating dioxygenase large terminal subunit